MDPNMLCDGCGAIGETCCNAAAERRQVANSLSRIVERQARSISKLCLELAAMQQVNTSLRDRMTRGTQ